MAHQEIVRALVPRQSAGRLRDELLDLDRASVQAVSVSAPDPATYRGEEADLELHQLVRTQGVRLGIGAVVGALLGGLLTAVLPWLHEWMPASQLVLMFGGAWAGAVVAAASGVQLHKRNDPLGETYYEVDADDAGDYRVLTALVPKGRSQVLSHLDDQAEATLLDSWDPKVGPREQPEQR